MPNYNVTFTTTFTSEVNANTPEQAIEAIEAISNDGNDFNITVVNIEEILPPISQSYVSLREFHNLQAAQTQNQENSTNNYVRFTTSTPQEISETYIPLFRSFI
jgi:hypothetical protein